MRPELYRPRALRVARRADLKQNREHFPVQRRELNAAWLDEPMRFVAPAQVAEVRTPPNQPNQLLPRALQLIPLIGELFGLAAMWYFETLILLCVSELPAPCDRLP